MPKQYTIHQVLTPPLNTTELAVALCTVLFGRGPDEIVHPPNPGRPKTVSTSHGPGEPGLRSVETYDEMQFREGAGVVRRGILWEAEDEAGAFEIRKLNGLSRVDVILRGDEPTLLRFRDAIRAVAVSEEPE